jgi:hypothetical protein
MRERLRGEPVCNVHGFARNIEKVYLKMWQERFEVRDLLDPARGQVEDQSR